MIFENAFCEANPKIAANTPAPAKRAVPNDLKKGILLKIKNKAIEKIIKLILELSLKVT